MKIKIKFYEKDNRWYEIANNYNNFSIVIVNENNFNLQDREIIETNYAINNKALFWKPSITQISYYRNILNS